MSATDRILLSGVRARGRHGVLAEERLAGQDFVVDLELGLDLAVAAATDRVVATVHYGELAQRVADVVAGEPVDLIETLAQRIADVVLADELVDRVVVTVHKPAAPIPVPFGDVAVRIERSRPAATEHVVIALGSNLGDREATLEEAVSVLHALPGLQVEGASASIETVAVTERGPDPSRPHYRNRVVVGRTSLQPRELLSALLRIERAFGRVRTARWGDRPLDLDLIAQGDRAVDEPGLVLPHPRARDRAFVLLPWLEVEPDAVLPGLGRVRHLAAALDTD
ncbi:2-amino-4-hydroxy-6-hydroxymethyldihydropteridine diphosphokinase [uncultured Amnibacterium sp.]|uniref:2-amino-4-hydroxy-6- hydroxymethyldihydropteridine diphosphokinase n=1 Tax=uncultured Amnibacterium sp. TaxID=1631851 RepID=UPI0035CBDCCB